MSQSNDSGAGAGQMSLASWRGCALYAQSILHAAHLPAELGPCVAALDAAIGALAGGPPAATAAAGLRVFTFGSNDKGALGQGVLRPPGREPAREIRLPSAAPLVGVCAGDSTSGFVTQAGELLLAGSNQHCIHGDRVSRGREAPTAVAALVGRRVSRAFMAGESIHVMAFVDGRLHAWGLNPKALGLDRKTQVVEPTVVELLGGAPLAGGVRDEAVATIAVGAGHTILLMQSGEAFACGSNSRGQLGLGAPRNPYDLFAFARPESVTGIAFVAAACGLLHSALVSADGRLYTCGANDQGQLGLGGPEDRYRLTAVSGGSIAGRRVVAVACGAASTLCLTDDGQVHGCGSNRKGELGLGDREAAAELTPVPLPGSTRAVHVCAGAEHALALGSDGSVFAWGENGCGQVTGTEPSRPVKQARSVECFAGQRAVAIAAGKAHSIVLTAG